MNHLATPRALTPSPCRTSQVHQISEAGDARRLRILYCASNEFLGKGFESANLDDVALAAGVGKATIYKYFNDKSDLFIHCVLDAVMKAAAPLREVLDANKPLEEVLCRFAALHITRMIQPVFGGRPFYEMARTLVGTSISHTDLARRCKSVFRQNLGVPLVDFFERKIARGEVAGDAGFLTEHFTQIIFFTNSVILEPETAPQPGEIDGLARKTVDLFLNGCRSRPN